MSMISTTVRHMYATRFVKRDLPLHLVLMTDPAIAYAPNENYSTFDRGSEADVWLKAENGSYLLGVVWPGTSIAISMLV